ncbi:MAG: preprotein translocase subunit SecA [Deltaproteobacteria bacterium]|nr:preprotein translocase subunit SecA [Deltaproteobacteria bacterium]
MIQNLLTKLFGSKNERELKKLTPWVERINALEPALKQLSDDQLRAKTAEFKERVGRGEALESLLPSAFAVVREASVRTLRMRHFDVQLIGGVVLHQGKISEMKTGEGKTLVATLPVYLNSLMGKGVHVVTVNDYLARRDAEWMGQIYQFLGLSVGKIVHGQSDMERREAYACDVTYGTNNEFGFDYLRDNMKFSLDQYVQRELFYAIVDEVDSILIDEARTPLIISGPAEESTEKYYQINNLIPALHKEADYTVDEKAHSVMLSEEGVARLEERLGIDNLYDPRHIDTLHHIQQALKAHALFKLDVDYVVKEGKVLIVDEFTGRLMPGRRYSDGLHQALEAKEHVKIENENQTLATITFQNYFRMYKKLAGMTGTADTEAEEFHKIYKLNVVVIPTNEPMIRTDHHDLIYKTEREKFEAVIREIEELNTLGRPALVGTVSIEKSERLSSMLKRKGISHHVLNAKYHEKEAEIIAQAGQPKAVTIATNMAGRGTDIVLGEGMAPLGGLHVVGTERHEARRIDNQLRGRSGRQGDPGSSRFYLSLEDDLLRIFGSERIAKMMETLGMEEGVPIEHKWLTKAIENAQKRVEGRNFDIRKHLIEYDDVMNTQRDVIYSMRREVLGGGERTRALFLDMLNEYCHDLVNRFAPEKTPLEEWDWEALTEHLQSNLGLRMSFGEEVRRQYTRETLVQEIDEKAIARYNEKTARYGEAVMAELEKFLMLHVIDTLWKEHLLDMDHLKEGIGLRGYGQKNPLLEYKREGFDLFMDMDSRIKNTMVERLMIVELSERTKAEEVEEMREKRARQQQMVLSQGGDKAGLAQPIRHEGEKVGRNDPCPCGSGKKYKKCHGSTTARV